MEQNQYTLADLHDPQVQAHISGLLRYTIKDLQAIARELELLGEIKKKKNHNLL